MTNHLFYLARLLAALVPILAVAGDALPQSSTSMPLDPREWQRHWHRVFDEYPHPETDPPGIPDPLEEMDQDTRLIYGFWHILPEARTKALAPLPRGSEIAVRVNHFMGTKRFPISEADAVALMRKGLATLRDVELKGPSVDAPFRTVLVEDWPPKFYFSQPLTDFHTDLGGWARRETGEAGEKAWYFLGEPFYEATSYYQSAAWMAWPLCAKPGAPDPTEAGFKLWMGGWIAGYDEDDRTLILLDMRKYWNMKAE